MGSSPSKSNKTNNTIQQTNLYLENNKINETTPENSKLNNNNNNNIINNNNEISEKSMSSTNNKVDENEVNLLTKEQNMENTQINTNLVFHYQVKKSDKTNWNDNREIDEEVITNKENNGVNQNSTENQINPVSKVNNDNSVDEDSKNVKIDANQRSKNKQINYEPKLDQDTTPKVGENQKIMNDHSTENQMNHETKLNKDNNNNEISIEGDQNNNKNLNEQAIAENKTNLDPIRETKINQINHIMPKSKPTTWDTTNDRDKKASEINLQNKEEIKNDNINDDHEIKAVTNVSHNSNLNHISKYDHVISNKNGDINQREVNRKYPINKSISENNEMLNNQGNSQNGLSHSSPEKSLIREQNILVSPIIYNTTRKNLNDLKYFDLGPYNNLYSNPPKNKETGEIDHNKNEKFDPQHDIYNREKAKEETLIVKNNTQENQNRVKENKSELTKTSNLDAIKEQDSILDFNEHNQKKKEEISKPAILSKEVNNINDEKHINTFTPKVNMDEISLKFEKNINDLLQRHVLSQRKFEEMKNDEGAVSNLNNQMKTFSDNLQQELDLYSRTVEKFFTKSGYTYPLDNENFKTYKKDENKDTTHSLNTTNSIVPLPSKSPNLRKETKQLSPIELKKETSPITNVDLNLIFGDLSSLDKTKNDEKSNNSRLSPFMTDGKNSRSPSISLDKSFSFESQKSNESIKIEVDESIKNWIDTIERLNQNTDLKNYCNSRDKNSFKTYNELKDFMKTSLAKTDFEKAWLVYFWICNNIEYDVSAFKQVKTFDIKPRSVFLQHKTVSAGYSSLFKDLCENLDLKCYHIKGYAKGFSFEYGKPLYHENHDWNSVQINNKMYLVETTWGAGYVTADHKFKRKFQPYHFCVPPHVFIEQHFSENCQYQEKKLTFDEFHRFAFKKLEFFLLGLECLNSSLTNITFKENPIQLSFGASSNIHLVASLKNERKEKITNCIFIQKNPEASFFEINVSLPDLNQHSLDIFALNETKKQYSFICRYYLKTRTLINKDSSKWCQSYQTNKNIYLYQPLQMLLDARQNYSFKIYADVDDVVLIDSKNKYSHFDRIAFETNVWYTEKYSLLRGNLDICVKYENDDTYWTCFSYEVF